MKVLPGYLAVLKGSRIDKRVYVGECIGSCIVGRPRKRLGCGVVNEKVK